MNMKTSSSRLYNQFHPAIIPAVESYQAFSIISTVCWLRNYLFFGESGLLNYGTSSQASKSHGQDSPILRWKQPRKCSVDGINFISNEKVNWHSYHEGRFNPKRRGERKPVWFQHLRQYLCWNILINAEVVPLRCDQSRSFIWLHFT